MARVLRIVAARTQRPGEFDAAARNEVPSPSPQEMLDALNDPIAYRQRSVVFERGVQQLRPAPIHSTPHNTGAPPPADLTAEIRKGRK